MLNESVFFCLFALSFCFALCYKKSSQVGKNNTVALRDDTHAEPEWLVGVRGVCVCILPQLSSAGCRFLFVGDRTEYQESTKFMLCLNCSLVYQLHWNKYTILEQVHGRTNCTNHSMGNF